ncbi:centromere protein L [Bombina bombina]|uniref:centromere protein L n=1 Tax=Bombina bombina TaxID=8345 RepID=UPI00235B1E83|nr:centromere protein L [Bombina bombina]
MSTGVTGRMAMQTPTDGTPTSKGGSTSRRRVHFQSTGFPLRGLTSARRHTPFRQAPSKRRIPQNKSVEENVDPSKIGLLLRKQWRLYSVTPLHKFSDTNLKDYARLLTAHIAAEKQKGLAVEVGLEMNLKVAFSSLPWLKGRDRDPGGILIQVSAKPQFSAADSEDRILWSGLFCCTFGDEGMLDLLPETMISLPLFLSNGSETFTATVGMWFQRTFDCSFSNLPISAHDLAWMTAMWTGYDVYGHAAATELVFSVPCEPQKLDISYAIHPDDVRALWDDIHKSQDEVTEEEVDLFFQCLYSHFFRHFKIHLSAARLVKVTTSVASAHCDGNVKFLCKEHLIRVLALLTELALNLQY